MKFYIGLGGIGCRTLHNYQEECLDKKDKGFYYVDSDQFMENSNDTYIVPGISYGGTGTLRGIGRNLVNYELYTGSLSAFFAGIKEADNVELIFVLSSFGGFGGAAVSPLLDYIEAISWGKLESCIIIAFNENAYVQWGFPKQLLQKFEANTIDFVNELSVREQSFDISKKFQKTMFNPGCSSFLIDTQNMRPNEFGKCIDFQEEKLKKLDCKGKYVLHKTEKKPDVFISYSSKDQEIADLIADELADYGIVPWIATRDIKEGSYAKQIMQGIREANIFLVLISKNSIASEQVKNEIDRAFSRIKDGMKLIPFILDDSELDDECQYYLCRQEMIFGETPPVSERVTELVRRIYEIIY